MAIELTDVYREGGPRKMPTKLPRFGTVTTALPPAIASMSSSSAAAPRELTVWTFSARPGHCESSMCCIWMEP